MARQDNLQVSSFYLTQPRCQVFYTGRFRQFARENIIRWRQIVEDWVGGMSGNMTLILLAKVILGSEVLVLHSGRMIEDRMAGVRTILDFLGLEEDARRLGCLEHANIDYFKVPMQPLRWSPLSLLFSVKAEDLRRVHTMRIYRRYSKKKLSGWTES